MTKTTDDDLISRRSVREALLGLTRYRAGIATTAFPSSSSVSVSTHAEPDTYGAYLWRSEALAAIDTVPAAEQPKPQEPKRDFDDADIARAIARAGEKPASTAGDAACARILVERARDLERCILAHRAKFYRANVKNETLDLLMALAALVERAYPLARSESAPLEPEERWR